jgi:hypothetical protein
MPPPELRFGQQLTKRRFSIIETSMTGFAQIPKKAKGYCDNTFSFTGQRDKIVYPLTLKGPYEGNFDLQTSPGISSWSPCGGSTAILNMNTQCNLSPTDLKASIAVSLILSNICSNQSHTSSGRLRRRSPHRSLLRPVAALPQVDFQTSIVLPRLP